MSPEQIIPRYKLLLYYNIRPEATDGYYQYVLGEFIPAMQRMGLYMLAAWHIAYGDYPMRQVEFVAEELESVQNAFNSPRWKEMERELQNYTTNLQHKVVVYRDGFQF
ncbi:MAG: hypothetical protein D6737_19900 [Chloroflexi bacterium]|nr:MAG: hypothetical protein D6737_19900 [Chloroflexota bacterium]